MTENGFHRIIGEKRFKYNGMQFSKISENKISSLYINMVVSSTPRTVKAKVIYAIHHHGARLGTKPARNNRTYKYSKLMVNNMFQN